MFQLLSGLLSMPFELTQAVAGYIAPRGGADGLYETTIPGLFLMRTSHPKLPRHMIYRPALCIVVQGAKRLMLGDASFDYAQMQALIVGLDLPASGRVIHASPDEPYLAINLDLDPAIINEVMVALETPLAPATGGRGLFVTDVGAELAESLVRLLRLLDTPKALPVLYPAIVREICYWLLTGPHGAEFARLAHPDGHTRRIAEAVRLLRDNFDKPIRIDDLAAAARMSPSSFYQHFKLLTAMTPLQYQKQLRLHEARRLMLADEVNVAGAAYEVGYESASQFSREYARMFGTSPRRDVAALRSTPVGAEIAKGIGQQ